MIVMDFISPIVKVATSAGLNWVPRTYHWAARLLRRRVLLHDAARIAYGEARACRSLLAEAAERMGPDRSRDGILNYAATYIAQDVRIWGRRPPSTRFEAIEPVQTRRGTFSDAGSVLRLQDPNHTVFTDLEIGRRDLRKVLRFMREEHWTVDMLTKP
jgi:hypothetical protein